MTNWFVKILTVSILFILSYSTGFAQLDCRSMIGAYIKPVSDSSHFSWGTELTLAPGVMKDRFIFNSIAIGGLEYSSFDFKHKAYFEGTAKYWYNTASGPGLDGAGTGYTDFTKLEKQHIGIRELFYNYHNGFDIKAGIQSLKSPDYFLIDERVLGVNAQKSIGSFTFDLQGGTVFKDIARMQDVCGTRHLFNLVRGGKISFVGDDPGDSNFALASITWTPGKKDEASSDTNTDEFQKVSGSDEFESFENEFSEFESDEFSSFNKTKQNSFKLDHLGIIYYEEFGDRFYDYKYYGGAFATFKFPAGFSLKGEIIQQITQDAIATFYLANLGKQLSWDNGGLTDADVQILGYFEQDEDIQFYPSFSNLFLGEMMRLDAMHSPLFSASIRHQFPFKNKLQLKLDYVRQLKKDNTQEFNLIAGMKVHKHAKLTTVLGHVSSDLMAEGNFLARCELRIAF